MHGKGVGAQAAELVLWERALFAFNARMHLLLSCMQPLPALRGHKHLEKGASMRWKTG